MSKAQLNGYFLWDLRIKVEVEWNVRLLIEFLVEMRNLLGTWLQNIFVIC